MRERSGVSMVALGAVLLLLGAAATAGAQAAGGTQTPRIGIIDLGRVLAKSSAGLAAREQLEREKTKMEHEMEGRRRDLEGLREELEKKGSLMTADARREKEDQLERKRREATRLADDFQRELSRKEQQLAQAALREIAGVVERIGKQRGYYYIVERRGGGVLYHAAEADITEEVIRAYDQETAAKGKK